MQYQSGNNISKKFLAKGLMAMLKHILLPFHAANHLKGEVVGRFACWPIGWLSWIM